MSTISSFRSIEHKHDVCRVKDCMKKFCEFLRQHTMKMINFKKEKMKLLTKEQQIYCCLFKEAKKDCKNNTWRK